MRSLERHAPALLFSAVVLYALMFAAFSHIKRDPRPSDWLTSVADRHYERLCRSENDVFPKGPHSAKNCARELRENAMMIALYAPIPLTILLGALLTVLTHLGLGALIIRTSSPLCATVRKGVDLIKLEPSLLSLPILACATVSLLLGLVFLRAFNDPRAVELNQDQYTALAWTVIFTPIVVTGYFATAYLLLLTNAALIHAYLAHAAGRPVSAFSSIAAAARLAPAIALLTVLVYGVLAGLYFAVTRLRTRLFDIFDPFVGLAAGESARFAGFFIESGLLIGTQLVVAAMLEERLSLLEALRRVSGLVKPAGREILTAAFGMATMRHDACAAALGGPIAAGYMCLPMFIDSFALGLAVVLASGILCGSLYFAFLSSLEGVFAAGIFAFASGGRVLPGLEKRELRAFLEGLSATAAGR